MTSAFVRLLLVSSSQLESRGRGRAESDVLRHAEAVLGNLLAIILELTTSDSVRLMSVVAATSETRRMRREAVMVGCMQGAGCMRLLARLLFLAPFSKRRYRQFRISQLSLLFCRFRFPRVGRPRSRSKISARPIQHHHHHHHHHHGPRPPKQQTIDLRRRRNNTLQVAVDDPQ